MIGITIILKLKVKVQLTMPKKGKGKKKEVSVPVYDSDDERRYSREAVPDPNDDSYYHDEVDQYHAQKDKVLLEKGMRYEEEGQSESEEDVLGLGVEDDDLLSDEDIQNYTKQLRRIKQMKRKDELGSDIEEGDEKDTTDRVAWGNRRSKFYGGDISDDDLDLSGSENEESAAVLEEKEALTLQKKMAAELDDLDFGLDIFKKEKKTKDKDKTETKIEKDLSKLSKKEKLQLLKKESPEMLPLIEDFQTKLKEAMDVFLPLGKLVKEGKIQGKAAEYVESKLQLALNYCTNISFYMMLKSKQIPVHNHPVIKRLVQYRNLMKQLEPVDLKLKDEIDDIMKRLKNGEDFSFGEPEPKTFVRRKSLKASRRKMEDKKLSQLMSDSEEEEAIPVPSKKKKRGEEGQYETKDEKAALEYYQMMKAGRKPSQDSDEEEGSDVENDDVPEDVNNEEELDDEEDDEGKRAITYQIQKNKGLTASKKKELRNPRVKHRMKYRKAKIRRRGQVREARTEVTRYGGEVSGIRAGMKRSIKMKA
ncbi:hypothetical protein FSP39_021428 [Pinctada imbricata]|uniref:Sas10 C-terminal domain-containing protein n=1 Tax=Pinctada imbricata TaxID=66713 RepID=A0AA88XSN4_PINIB|nr:hypothetical protein FSP39_021428 [Pinctada imbricata]